MIRIIGGKHRSRIIETPDNAEALPTKNLVREALFSILGKSVDKAIVLDLFAGSGALGLEALSRGASKAYFADRDESAVRTIKANLAALKEEASAVVKKGDYLDVISYLGKEGVTIDIAFIDPPYKAVYYESLIAMLLSSEMMADDSLIVVESKRDIGMPILEGRECRRYRYGISRLLIIRK